MASPGLQFYCEPLSFSSTGLYRTPSTYSYGNRLELCPTANRLYVICADGSVQDANDSNSPIGWELFETSEGGMVLPCYPNGFRAEEVYGDLQLEG